MVSSILAILVSAGAATGAGQVAIGPESAVPTDPRQRFARYVRFRPADGQTVTLNPPRFSWPYVPTIAPKSRRVPGDRRFTLQIGRTRDFAKPEVVVERTECNFYNCLPELTGSRTWHWRVGYHRPDGPIQWSKTRAFTIASDAVVWDRSALADVGRLVTGHPRLLFNAGNLQAIRDLRKTNPLAKELAEHIIATADKTLGGKLYVDFPKDDKKNISYMQLGRGMTFVAFAYVLTGEAKYRTCKERFLRMASWPKGGYASPEGVVRTKWSTHLTEYLGLFYDWFHGELTEAERAIVRRSIEWRIRHTMWSFAWKRREGAIVPRGSIALSCSSHPYENTMVTLPGALAVHEESKVARDAFDIGLNYLIGITNGMGEDEAWNEGPGYGNGKMKWLMDATCYLNTAIPQLHLERNEAYSALGDFFARITPVGAQHSSFGNRGLNEVDWCASRVTNFLRLALLRQDGRFMHNWLETRRRLADIRKRAIHSYSPWIDYCMLAYHKPPEPKPESAPSRLFGLEGWVTANSAAPSDYDAQKGAVSMPFHCRPRGGHSHAFRNENAFDIHAYGATVTSGGGSTSNQSFFANHTISHNTVLVNGHEQAGAKSRTRPMFGRVIAFKQGDGYVYWAGDATDAYAPKAKLARFVRHVVFVDNAYFVVFDDLALESDAPPGAFQWLYHVYPAAPLEIDGPSASVRYAIGKTRVLVRHLAHVGDLTIENRRGVEGMRNPITGEDLTGMGKWNKDRRRKNPKPLDAHHLWVSHKTPRRCMRFLAVIAPYRDGEAEPVVEPAGVRAAKVSFRGRTRVIAFERSPDAHIAVDADAIVARHAPDAKATIRVGYVVYTPEGEGGVGSKSSVDDYLAAVEDTEVVSTGMKFPDIKNELTGDRYDVLYFPGGGKSSVHAKALGKDGQDRIRAFVRNGGGYLGICAGAYAAASGPNAYNMGLVNAKVASSWTVTGHVGIRMADGAADVFTSPEYAPRTARRIVHANGPLLAAPDPSKPGYVAVATFTGDEVTQCRKHIPLKGYPSILYGFYGKGRVIVCSSHPEIADKATGNAAMLPEMIRWLVGRAPERGGVVSRRASHRTGSP